MLIQAKFPSTCSVCSKQILTGDRISWTKGVKAVSHAVCSAEGQELQTKLAPSRATDSVAEIPCPEGLSYLGYQKAGVSYLVSKGGNAIVGDEMGLGKTIQAIGYVNATPEVRNVLVVCPASLKVNWRNEFRKWLAREMPVDIFPTVLSGTCVTIINYDQLKKLPKSFGPTDLLILDEAHYIKNPKSQRSKLVSAIRKNCKRCLVLTGTPIANRPIELFPLLQLVDPKTWDPGGLKGQAVVGDGEGAGFFRFAKRYCNAQKRWFGKKSFWDFTGSSNLVELQEKLRLTCMVRRLKKDVLIELPPKRRQTIVLPKNGSSADVDAENEA